MTLCYIDTETLGLDLDRHDIWEIAYAFDDEPVQSAVVTHNAFSNEPQALAMNGYLDRIDSLDRAEAHFFELSLLERFHEIATSAGRVTMVGANPAFDMYRLRRRWGFEPWHHRPIDVESYAMSVLGHDRPQGLNDLRLALVDLGHDIPAPNHSAAGDVETTREVYRALRRMREAF